ncbi:putative methyltransferase [Sulfobacillus acidophilus TPY]|uniref:Methyltransferase n=1 Tax=Sulfobacillus acidophilus (strain ATCC 700253 / DSM 10332 / NAL) TaxID=679936 RepID=G8TVY8_SULAD|nr:putative methyltransferase [Sulfobacillus acidophilus TPY]AEW05915.1 methyltransferase [Sulfobacillus acidophilus DSM 10332]
MRIVGGQASGHRLVAPRGMSTRPTGERVREALFNIWQRRIESARFLDLYGGSGAMALEAVSRGAREAVVVEPDKKARAAIRHNIRHLGFDPRVRLVAMTAEQAVNLWADEDQRFDVVFCDPPWAQGVSGIVRSRLAALIGSTGEVVIEHAAKADPGEVPGLLRGETRRYGDTAVTRYWAERQD